MSGAAGYVEAGHPGYTEDYPKIYAGDKSRAD